MRRLFLLLFCLTGASTFILAQEKYFHDLRGLEDSTGTTHLFYRMHEFESYTFTCDDYKQTFQSSWNSVYHLDLSEDSDTLFLEDYSLSGGCTGFDLVKNVIDYIFFDNDITKWIANGFAGCSGMSIWDYRNRSTHLPSYCITKAHPKEFDLSSKYTFILNESQDSLFLEYSDHNFKFTLSDSIYPQFNYDDYLYYEELVDTLADGPAVFAINPYFNNIYYSKDNDWNLIVSQRYSTDFQTADSTLIVRKLAFDKDPNTVYALVTEKINDNYISGISISEDKGLPNSWSDIFEVETGNRLVFIETDALASGQIFVASDNAVFKSSDYGKSFEKITTTEIKITGLHKKAGTSHLYILTRENLIEFNLSTMEEIVLKSLPVSNEVEPNKPTKITLNQNYPNPFNPSTVISYQLALNSFVRLKIFDALGREVAVLEDGFKLAGNHSVTFDASSLSSGIYFYQLETNGLVLTKKLTLIK